MPIQSITTKVISTLGNKESLIPIIAKDAVDSASLTYNAYKAGGKVEGIDRAFDEFGTQAIWIGGIPFFKKLYDLTAYKIAKINPDVDIRILQNPEYAKWATKNAKGIINNKGEQVKDALGTALKDGGKKAIKLYKGKVIVATALTLGSYFLLTKTKHKNTEKNVLKKMNNDVFKKENNSTKKFVSSKGNLKYSNLKSINKPQSIFEQFENKKTIQNPSFKGIGKDFCKNIVDGVLFNPVHNMKIIDAGITTERLACSRNTVEFVEHGIKEGAFLFTLYGLGGKIEAGIDKLADKIFKTPIDLPIEVLMDKNFEKALKGNQILSAIAEMPDKKKALIDKLNFIVKNPDNALVQAAKKSNIVSTAKTNKGIKVVDTSKYINTNDLYTLADKLKNIDDKFKKSKLDVNVFLNKAKALKVASVLANIGISCAILGFLIPKAVYKYREMKTGSVNFHVAKNIEQEQKSKNNV